MYVREGCHIHFLKTNSKSFSRLYRGLVPARRQREAARAAAAVLGTPRRSHAAARPSALRLPAHPPGTAGGLLRGDVHPAAHTYLPSAKRKPFSRALKLSWNLVEFGAILFYPPKAEHEKKQIISLPASWDSAGLFRGNTVLPFAVLAEKRGRKAVLPVRLAQGVVAAHRVSRVGDVVGDLQPLW